MERENPEKKENKERKFQFHTSLFTFDFQSYRALYKYIPMYNYNL